MGKRLEPLPVKNRERAHIRVREPGRVDDLGRGGCWVSCGSNEGVDEFGCTGNDWDQRRWGLRLFTW